MVIKAYMQSGNRSGEIGPVRPDRTGAGPDRLKYLDRPVSTGFLPVYKDLFVEKYIRGSPQALMKKKSQFFT